MFVCRKLSKDMNVETIKKQLPHGAIKEIAARSGASNGTVRNVLNGIYTNGTRHHKIIDCAINYLQEYKAKQKDLSKKFNEVLNT